MVRVITAKIVKIVLLFFVGLLCIYFVLRERDQQLFRDIDASAPVNDHPVLETSKQKVARVYGDGKNALMTYATPVHTNTSSYWHDNKKESKTIEDIRSGMFSTNLPEVTSSPMDTEMADRQHLVEQMCAKHVGFPKRKAPSKTYYVKPYDFYTCLVAKVASTFMSRFLYQLHHTYPVESPFNVGVAKAYNGLGGINTKKQHNLDLQNVSTKLLFVREPYGRLFSAYIDKLLPPNPVFWKTWGRNAVLEFRKERPANEFVFGSDTTFSEFISFAIKRGSNHDVHLSPIHRQCHPCTTNFSTIGKMESFEQDAKYVISRLGIPESQIGFDRMEANREQDALIDSIGGSFSPGWLSYALRAITREAAAQRVWRKMQIRGFISWRQRLRLTPRQKENLNASGLLEMLKQAKLASTNRMELKIQKKQAFLEAYSTLTFDQIQQIQTVYGPDFQLFGYDMDLVEISGLSDFMNTYSLDWSRDWDLSPVLETSIGS